MSRDPRRKGRPRKDPHLETFKAGVEREIHREAIVAGDNSAVPTTDLKGHLTQSQDVYRRVVKTWEALLGEKVGRKTGVAEWDLVAQLLRITRELCDGWVEHTDSPALGIAVMLLTLAGMKDERFAIRAAHWIDDQMPGGADEDPHPARAPGHTPAETDVPLPKQERIKGIRAVYRDMAAKWESMLGDILRQPESGDPARDAYSDRLRATKAVCDSWGLNSAEPGVGTALIVLTMATFHDEFIAANTTKYICETAELPE